MAKQDPKQNPKLDAGDDRPALESGDDQEALQSGEDLAKEALAETSESGNESDEGDEVNEADEVEESDQIAETLNSLQNLIERRALQVEEIKEKLRDSRAMLRDVFDNDETLTEVQEELKTHSLKVKERKSQLSSNPEAMSLKLKIGELRDEQKELEETLSNHLVNYHSMTNSNSFDTSDGDQWEFSIKARIKPRKKQQD